MKDVYKKKENLRRIKKQGSDCSASNCDHNCDNILAQLSSSRFRGFTVLWKSMRCACDGCCTAATDKM